MKRSLAIHEKVLGPDHPETARTLGNLASLYTDQGRHAKAEPLSKRSLAICEKTLGPDHPDTKRCRENLANLHKQQAEATAGAR